jgi:hypothetical protein
LQRHQPITPSDPTPPLLAAQRFMTLPEGRPTFILRQIP